MKSGVFICIAWIGTSLFLRAAPIKLESLSAGSLTFSNVTVLGFNASDLYFTSDLGIRNVKLRLLDPDMQQKFHYDPVAAAKAEEQQAEDEKRYQDNLAAQLTAQYNAARDAKEAEAQAIYAQAGLADPATADSSIGRTAPALDMETWVGAKPNMDGKFVLVSVWSPKSPSCNKWIPALNALDKTLADKAVVVGVTSATRADVEQADPRPDFPCAIDSDSRFINGANVTTFPCVLLLDPDHVIRYHGHPAALTAEMLQKVLNQVAERSAEQSTERAPST